MENFLFGRWVMNDKNYVLLIFICLALVNLCLSLSQSLDRGNWNQEKLENYLRTAEVVSVEKDTEAGRTTPWRITLNDGITQRQALFKYINRSRPSLLPDSYKYEIAAYELDKLLELEIVPPVVEREIEGTTGSLQLYLEGCIREAERKRRKIDPPDPVSFQNMLEVINVFENLVLEEDCFDADDILVDLDGWKAYRVDFSMAFSPLPEIISECKINKCSRKLYNNLLQLGELEVRNKLKLFLNDQEIEALLQRKNIIIKKIGQLIKEKGKDSVLFD
jgi:hypothetical protein